MSAGRIIIVGGGATGVILAAHLLREDTAGLRVTIIERRAQIGRGIAYDTDEPDHILNTRAGSMSAYADDPEHFWRWLQSNAPSLPDAVCPDAFCFVRRGLFGLYLDALVTDWLPTQGDGRLEVLQGEVTSLKTSEFGVAVELATGELHIGHAAVLATGHPVPAYGPQSPYISPWQCSSDTIGTDDPVLILGTGLSMVDSVFQLARQGHSGPITALSRRGLLPRPHQRTKPLKIDAADVPFGTELSYLTHWFRQTARWRIEHGADWRDVIDGIRPHIQSIWQSLPLEARQRFLRHARSFWEVHRHRIPPESNARLSTMIAEGRLRILAGRLLATEPTAMGHRARIRHRDSRREEQLDIVRVIDCTGILRPQESCDDGLSAQLIARGLARRDALNIGLDVDDGCALIDPSGRSVPRLYAAGPVTRSRFWEITAVPDIRVQAAMLAARLRTQLSGGNNRTAAQNTTAG
ncbi:FAD/NAD(P)-binding protein [Jiella sp. MQZ9-1]|uniref:FAD/NAD(P)-binding protein n=1 Tax=Jiella flava TaxID=2816857 RepID=A0A939FVU1_9HYPH|nr:FAD/NAD(P)-binding protein [Jiella flava]MBO0662442.1 FAD/NAD(P)-binding protein [Jiella flava]MCD2471666.1 FAD/NAD(P)-binding protein [Jiella flava]